MEQYITPADISLRRKVAHQAILEKDGYRTIVFNLSPEWGRGESGGGDCDSRGVAGVGGGSGDGGGHELSIR